MTAKSPFNNEYLNSTAVGHTPLTGLSGSTTINQSSGYTMDDKIKPIIQDILFDINSLLGAISNVRYDLNESVNRIHPIPNYPEPGEYGAGNSPTVPSIVDTLKGIQEALKVEISKLDEISKHLKTVV